MIFFNCCGDVVVFGGGWRKGVNGLRGGRFGVGILCLVGVFREL